MQISLKTHLNTKLQTKFEHQTENCMLYVVQLNKYCYGPSSVTCSVFL